LHWANRLEGAVLPVFGIVAAWQAAA